MLELPEVGLSFNDVFQKVLQVFIVTYMPKNITDTAHLDNEAVRDAYTLTLCKGLTHCCRKIGTIIEPLNDAIERLIGIVFLSHTSAVFCHVRCKYVGIVSIEMLNKIEGGAQ